MQAEAVTVTALGGRKQNRALGYATSTVKGDELSRTNTLSPANALQGKVAGVQIATSGSGGVTTSPSVTIRGNKSLNKNNSPIYVIDGIIMQYDETKGGGNSDIKYGNQLKNLNSDDYESVTVLKGAAATSLYGSRGANGAIVITTKQGKARKGIGVEVNYTHEWQSVYRNSIPLQNLYGQGDPRDYMDGNSITDPDWNASTGWYEPYSFGPSFASMQGKNVAQFYKYTADVENPEEAFVAHKDNWKAFYQTAQYDKVSVALTGGSEKATFRLSYAYTDNKGAIRNNEFNSHSINFTANGKINDVFSTNLSVQYSNSNTSGALTVDNGNWNSTIGMMAGYYINRNTDLQWYKDHYIDPETHARYGTTAFVSSGYGINPLLESLATSRNNRNEQTLITQLGLSAQFTDWLDANVSISYNNWQIFSENKQAGSYTLGHTPTNNNTGVGLLSYGPSGSYSIDGSTSGSYDGIAQLHSNNRFLDDNLELDVRLVGEVYGNTRSTSFKRMTQDGLITFGHYSFSNSYSPEAIQVNSPWKAGNTVGYTPRNNMTIGLAGIVNLAWKDQIFLEVTARNDWLSTLMYPSWIPYGQNNYSVFYPSVNASWVFSDTFNIDPKILSFGKLRASWAQVGSGTSPYSTADGAGGFNQSSTSSPDQGNLISATPNNTALPNYDLKPEIQTSIEFGADLRFLNGMIGVDVAYYKTNTKNQILKLNTVAESGVTERLINAGNIQNQGWEIQLDVTPIRTRTVNWNIGMNWSRNRGKIKELYEGQSVYTIYGGVDGSAGIYAFEGGAYGVLAAGNTYGAYNQPSGSAGPRAVFNNVDDPNDPRNGKYLMYVSATDYYGVDFLYNYVNANRITGYYGEEASYWGGKKNVTTILGNVQPDFIFGINTNVQVNLPNNSGSIDFFGQIDGRSGGYTVNNGLRYATGAGNAKRSLYGRDKEHGGVARVNYKGDIEYNGIIPDAVFWDKYSTVTSLKTGEEVDLAGMTFREAIEEGHVQPWLATLYHATTNGWAAFPDSYLSKQSYVALRELTLGYNFPEKWIKHVGLQSARLSFTARNVCYLYNGLTGKTNPESSISNSSLNPIDVGTTPFVRNFAIALNLRF